MSLAVCYQHTLFFFFFFNDTATTEIYTLSLHDALPISGSREAGMVRDGSPNARSPTCRSEEHTSELQSHSFISYAVFCLKKKTNMSATHVLVLSSLLARDPMRS